MTAKAGREIRLGCHYDGTTDTTKLACLRAIASTLVEAARRLTEWSRGVYPRKGDRGLLKLVASFASSSFTSLERSVPKFHFEIPHSLTAADAKSRLERFVESLSAKFQDKVSDLNQSWNGNTLAFGFKTFGIKINGDITAKDNQLDVTGEIPFTAMMFKGKIESEVREQLGRLMKS